MTKTAIYWLFFAASFVDCARAKNLTAQGRRGEMAAGDNAPEVLVINGPAYD